MTRDEINKMLNERDEMISDESVDKRADEIQEKIESEIMANFDKYDVDFILETWTRFGAAPSFVYDDNGMFAIVATSMQPVVIGDEKMEGAITVFVEKEDWKPTIREALKYWLTRKD